jgi:ABC-2 type transport system ATP-binding protein
MLRLETTVQQRNLERHRGKQGNLGRVEQTLSYLRESAPRGNSPVPLPERRTSVNFIFHHAGNLPEAFRGRRRRLFVIHVSNLTKYYGDYAAIRNVSFEVPKGQVVGFLGPNGAGKSTTMRILAGYLTATSGRATIAGFDVFWQPVEVRRHIGYMPENCPLYPEMRVVEYLRFRAGIKGLHGGEAKKRVEYVLDRCWVRDVRRQLIGTLSKGYRQRVGLADVLLNNPPVLILDEPTAGLDPGQIRETRKLIRELGQEHTILLSTHILSEVEVTCDQAIIINRGQVVAAGRLVDLKPEHQSLEEMFIHLIERDSREEQTTGAAHVQ